MSALVQRRRGVWFDSPPPLSLYIHFPWCVRKCPYCDFNSHERKPGDEDSEARYLEAFQRDLEAALPSVWGRRIETIFIGGGTPSLLSAAGLETLLQSVRTYLPLHPEVEITLEANPGTVDRDHFDAYRQAGVNRVSLGIQSFSADQLKTLGRIHTVDDAEAAIEIAVKRFPRVNLDLMVALPHQTVPEALNEVDRALLTGVSHLSCYQLTLEPNTPFFHAPPPMLSSDEAALVSEAVTERLLGSGFHHYETSAYAKPGMACLHNINYWTFGDYLGLGPGAHSKLSYRTEVVREVRHRSPKAWMDALLSGNEGQQLRQVVPVEDLPFEFAMNAFRLTDGFEWTLFEKTTGLSRKVLWAPLEKLEEQGLVRRDLTSVKPTELGSRFLNDVISAFLPDA